MESHKNIFVRHNKLLKSLSSLPEKILGAHHHEKLTELVLYELSHPNCFNFSKAAYFVNNTDFNLLHGIAGFCKNEHTLGNNTSIWQEPEKLHEAMAASAFHKQVRDIKTESIKLETAQKDTAIKRIAEELHFVNPSHYSWETKHGNQAILLFEHEDPLIKEEYSEELLGGVSLLGFCGIY